MNNDIRNLISYVCQGNLKSAQMQAKNILEADNTEKNKRFREDMIHRLEMQKGFENLPQNLKSLLVIEEPENYPEGKFLLRDNEMTIAEKTLSTYRASSKLIELGIPYLPTLMLYGKSGCGKTELARYIAYKANLPFIYVRFSNLVTSYLGSTQKNIASIFEYVRTTPCVLCFDEIDTIGMARGQRDDVGEMNRVVIALMQEMDRLPNNVIIIGTTNRFDRLDEALVRRFSLQYEVTPLSEAEGLALADRFFGYAGIKPSNLSEWYSDNIDFFDIIPAHKIVKACTEYIVNEVLKEGNAE